MDDRERDKRLARLIFKEGLVERVPLEERLAELKDAGCTGLADVLVERGDVKREDADRLSEAVLHGDSTEVSGWRVGARIGDYVLRERIGKGSMGVVYRCRHARTQQVYAIKALSKKAGAYMVSRFEREGQAQAQVDTHPSVVRVHSAGEEAGCLYLVMDLCTGGDLETKLRSGPLPERAGAELIMQLARGLAHVHERGVLHRDLKPANVLFDQDGTPRLVDFGLARVEEGEALTRTGDLIGTPTYMAPEQARGKHRNVDERADVYGLAAILYHVLTGARPFVGVSTIEVVHKVLASEPPKPTTLIPSLDPRLEAICLKGMAKIPDMRTPSAAALADELEAYLAEGQQTERMPKGMRMLIGVTAVCLLLGLIGVGVAVTRGDPALPSNASGADGSAMAQDPPPVVPPQVKLTDLRWDLPRGTVARCSITHTFDIQPPQGDEPGRQRSTYKSYMRSGWTWQLKRSTSESVTIVATLDTLQVRRESLYGPIDFDSERAGDETSPFTRAIGARFSFDVATASGQVSNVQGAEDLQERIQEGVLQEGLSVRRLIYATPHLSDDQHLQNFLNTLFCVLPGRPHDLSKPWSLDEVIIETPDRTPTEPNHTSRRGRNMDKLLGLPLPDEALPLLVKGRRLASGRYAIEWSGKEELRELRGEAELADGRVRKVELNETQRRPSRSGRGFRRLKLNVVFELKGRR